MERLHTNDKDLTAEIIIDKINEIVDHLNAQ